jgi:phosphatidylinositol glycan class A protein
LKRYYGCGQWAGKLFCIVVGFIYLYWRFLEWISPREDIDLAIDFPTEEYKNLKKQKNMKS